MEAGFISSGKRVASVTYPSPNVMTTDQDWATMKQFHDTQKLPFAALEGEFCGYWKRNGLCSD